MADRMKDQQADKWNQCQPADQLRAASRLGGRCECLVHPLLSHHGAFVVSGSGEHVVSIERTREFFTDKMP